MKRYLAVFLALALPGPYVAWAQEPDDEPAPKSKKDDAFKRRDTASEDDLRKQLLGVPESGYNQVAAFKLYTTFFQSGSTISSKSGTNVPPDVGAKFLANIASQLKRPDMIALPWRAGLDCQLGKEAAERLHVLSVNLRANMRKATPQGDIRPDADDLRKYLTTDQSFGRAGIKPAEWKIPEAIPTLTQMLQTENIPLRLLLVELLSEVKGKEASQNLVRRAVYDLAPEVREKAVQSLANRPYREYKDVLVEALRSPWPPAADHAAEMIVALNLKEAVSDLFEAIKLPNPALPFEVAVPTKSGKEEKTLMIREMVRINHMSNCVLCHAASHTSDDLVRGRVPIPNEEPPPGYYQATTGLFVRAEITYLRQDFSVMQPVANPGKWPTHQRFDYLIRTRRAIPAEVKLYKQLQNDMKLTDTYPQQESILFAIKEITKKDLELREAIEAPPTLLRGILKEIEESKEPKTLPPSRTEPVPPPQPETPDEEGNASREAGDIRRIKSSLLTGRD